MQLQGIQECAKVLNKKKQKTVPTQEVCTI